MALIFIIQHRHKLPGLKVSALALLMLGILTNDANTAFSFNDLAFIADRLYRRSYLHVNPPFIMLDLRLRVPFCGSAKRHVRTNVRHIL